jgi:ABC-type glycerol-3-phosphate transport system substrate-binding protein
MCSSANAARACAYRAEPMRRRDAAACLIAAPLAAAAAPACQGLGLQGQVDLVANSFPAMQHLARLAEQCSAREFKVRVKLTPQVQNETELAFASAGRSPFDAAVVSQGVFSTLYSRNHLHPLTDLVRRLGPRYALEERMLVRMNGEVMAIAFMQNTQHLFYRADLFERHGLAVPTSYPEMLACAKVLKAREPGVANPIAQTFAKGWDLATEFTNLLPSLDGRFFEPGSAEPAFQGAAGVEAVALLRAMLPYMTPNALASNSDDVMNQLQQGRAAMGVLWASRAARMDDPAASRVVGKIAFAAAPAARPGGRSASHLWWDGVAMPRNGRGNRDAVFHVLMQMLGSEAVEQGQSLAIWVRSNYRPGRTGVGVQLAHAAGAPVWPGEPFFSLAHSQLGRVLPDALAGLRSTPEVLAGAARAYRAAAIEKGFIRSTRAAA